MVLLFILTALVLRNKLNPNGLKMGPSSLSSSSNNTTPHHQHHLMNSGTLAYDSHCTQVIGSGGEFGNGSGCYAVVTPGELRKSKLGNGNGSTGSNRPEYQEPFLSPKLGNQKTMNTGAGVGTMSAAFPGANQTIVAATMKGKMVEYYSCTLVPNNNIMGQQPGMGNNIGKFIFHKIGNCSSIFQVNGHSTTVHISISKANSKPNHRIMILIWNRWSKWGSLYVSTLDNVHG